MSTPAYAVRDSRTMLRRNLRHMWRYPTLTLMVAGIPVVFLLLFVYVFGGTLGAGLGVLAMITLATTWLSVACGLVSKTVEAASNLPMPLMLLPFLGSGFVPTKSMPTALRWFAEYQPFTPFIETLRGLLLGTAIGNSAAVAVAWCVGITLVSFLWARAAFNRDPGPAAT
jgi:ABC-2 type transport system permease protein